MDDLMSPDFFFIYHTFDVILGHISISDEIYGSSWSCMLVPIYEMYAEMMARSLFYHDPLVESLGGHPVRLVLLDTYMSSCFSFREIPLGFVGMILLWTWMTRVTHLMMDDLMFLDFSDLSHIWCHFPFWLRLVYLHGFAWSSPVARYPPGWFSDGAFSWVIQFDSHFLILLWF